MSTKQKPLFQPVAPPSPLKVVKIDIDHVMGLEEFDVEPGAHFNIVRGPNGSGKSSFLEGVKNVFAGGNNLANLAHLGPDGTPGDPRVVIVLKGEGLEEYILTKNSKGLTIKERVGNTAAHKAIEGSPGEWLKRMFDAQMCSPAKFLLAKETDQLSMFLEALPIKLDVARVKEIVGRFWPEVEKANLSWEWLQAIQALAAIRTCVYNARTGVNVSYDSKKKTAYEMLLDAPAEVPEGLPALITAKREEINRTEAALGALQTAIQSDYRQRETDATAKRDAAIAEAKRVFEADIANAKEAIAGQREEAARLDKELVQAKADLADLDRTGRLAIEAETKKATAAKYEAEANSLKGQADEMTAVLNALDAYKEEMADEIPIKGLTIEGGLKLNGIPFASCNTAARVKVAFHVGLFRVGRLRAMFLDSFENLDAESRGQLLDLAREHDVQLFAGQVADSDLEVEKG